MALIVLDIAEGGILIHSSEADLNDDENDLEDPSRMPMIPTPQLDLVIIESDQRNR